MSEGDAMTSVHLGQKFSTRDQDNDASSSGSCAVWYKGAWWYRRCHDANLNGEYNSPVSGEGVIWGHWKGHDYSLRFTEMKIKPFNA